MVAALDGEVLADDFCDVRAAAQVLVLLGRVHVWPIETLQADLQLAVVKLGSIRNNLAREEEPYQFMIDGVDLDQVAFTNQRRYEMSSGSPIQLASSLMAERTRR